MASLKELIQSRSAPYSLAGTARDPNAQIYADGRMMGRDEYRELLRKRRAVAPAPEQALAPTPAEQQSGMMTDAEKAGVLGAATAGSLGYTAYKVTRPDTPKPTTPKIAGLDLRPSGTQLDMPIEGGSYNKPRVTGPAAAMGPVDNMPTRAASPNQMGLFDQVDFQSSPVETPDRVAFKDRPRSGGFQPKTGGGFQPKTGRGFSPKTTGGLAVALGLLTVPQLVQAYVDQGYSTTDAYKQASLDMGMDALFLGGNLGDPNQYQGGPMQGFGFVNQSGIDPTLGGLFSNQSFDSINNLLLNQYMEGISPYADVQTINPEEAAGVNVGLPFPVQ